MDIAALTWSWMNVLTTKRAAFLREQFGSLEVALQHVDTALLRSLGCREETALQAINRLDEFDAETYAADIERRGITLLSDTDALYPRALRSIVDAPVFLSVCGDVSCLEQPCIGLVGTRTMSPYGRRIAERFVPALVRAGCTTVSGLAIGIDAAVAEETLAAGGATVAVLGHGLGMVYPKSNARLARRIVEEGGVVLSEFPLDTPPDRYTFPARNRIIAGLSAATVVLEAGEDSGSLITADLALGYGRDVFAVPGPVFEPGYAGCHGLIARGAAQLVATPEEVLLALGCTASQESPRSYQANTEEEAAVYAALTSMPQHTGALVEKTGLPSGDVAATLTMLELAGAARQAEHGAWIRS